MEKRVNTIFVTYIKTFKDNIRNKINEMNFDEKTKINDLMGYIYDYEKPIITKETLQKKKRVKNVVADENRCGAKRANGEQCSRSRKMNCDFCGTHSKGIPHGMVVCDNKNVIKKIEVFTYEIKGIVYYMDKFGNVYKMEDILEEKQDPAIISKYVRNENGEVTIPGLGL
jgi:hypothetical protein